MVTVKYAVRVVEKQTPRMAACTLKQAVCSVTNVNASVTACKQCVLGHLFK